MIELITRSFLLLFGILMFSVLAIYLIPIMIKYKDFYESIEIEKITYSISDVVKYCIIETQYADSTRVIAYFPSTVQKKSYKLICQGNKIYIYTRTSRIEYYLPEFVQCNFMWSSGNVKLHLECKKINNTIIINILR